MKRNAPLLSLLLSVLLLAMALPLAAADANARSTRRHGASPTYLINGIVMSQTSKQLVVRTRGGDVSVIVTPQTRIGTANAPATVSVSSEVQVRVAKDTKGANVALSIEVEPDVVEVEGAIQTIATTTLTVRNAKGDTTVALDATTIVVVKGAVASFADLVVGDTVEVHGLRRADGSVLALLVVAEAENIEIHGVIKAVDASAITVTTDEGSDVVLTLSAGTEIRLNGKPGAVTDLHAGQRVEVDAQRASDGTLEALVVKLEASDQLLEINGTVKSSTATSLTITTKRGVDVVVGILADTIITKEGHALPAVQINVGDRVEVKATTATDGTLAAVRIRVEDSEHDLLQIHGIVSGVAGSVLTITQKDGTSVPVTIDAQTIIKVDEHAGTVADLVAGARVEIAARANADGSLTAIAIRLETEDEDDAFVEIEGVIASKTDTSITVTTEHDGDVTVGVTPDTVIRKDGAEAALADLEVGDDVEVKAEKDSGGALVALAIHAETPESDDAEIEASGEVTAVSATSITVHDDGKDVTFGVTPTTVVRDGKSLVTIAAIKVGDAVEVEGMKSAMENVALVIKLEHD
ncbi:MAG: DUF5666 domain-containing protein [Thermoanaerobaculia bacterium]|jgi:hypothetical protein